MDKMDVKLVKKLFTDASIQPVHIVIGGDKQVLIERLAEKVIMKLFSPGCPWFVISVKCGQIASG